MSLQPVIRIGDPGSHGGQMVSGTAGMKADGLEVCCVGDLYACGNPRHGTNPLTQGSATTRVNGKALGRINEDRTACGATITAGSPTMRST
jgi:uncharacterized Zn-binding protein involved in type VI secretion